MPRPRESGYRSQLYILLVLRKFGPLYGQEIVDKISSHRQEIWRNLKVLLRKGIIKKERVGRRVYYRPNVDSQTFDYVIMILGEGGLRKVIEKSRKLFKKMKKTLNQMILAAKKVDKSESELIELAYSKAIEPYMENLPHAKQWKQTKKLKIKVGLKPSIQLPESRKTEIRNSVLHPKSPVTKDVALSSGSRFTIRKMTALELLDIVRKVKKQESKDDPYLIEAIKRLAS